MGATLISLQNVWKIYDLGKIKVEAVRGISMDIKRGEFVAIMGPSGSGKTTLLNMIGCLDIPTRGRIYLQGKDISVLPESILSNYRGRKIGFIFQTYNLIPTLTALENVELPMIFQGVDGKERKKRAKELLELMGLSHRAHHKPMELSGGQQQRVAIARALANNPDIIIADEPTGNLDSKAGKDVMEQLRKLNDGGKTIIVVTHDPEIASYAHRIAYIKDGKIDKEVKK